MYVMDKFSTWFAAIQTQAYCHVSRWGSGIRNQRSIFDAERSAAKRSAGVQQERILFAAQASSTRCKLAFSRVCIRARHTLRHGATSTGTQPKLAAGSPRCRLHLLNPATLVLTEDQVVTLQLSQTKLSGQKSPNASVDGRTWSKNTRSIRARSSCFQGDPSEGQPALMQARPHGGLRQAHVTRAPSAWLCLPVRWDHGPARNRRRRALLLLPPRRTSR